MHAAESPVEITDFSSFDLEPPIQQALESMGYITPSAIQAKALPLLRSGRDVLGQAATGTGKTAAFALPALAQVDISKRVPQVLVLTPTRELALQVADAFSQYSQFMQGLSVLPIYGGQGYETQLRALKRGAQVIIGTPGRIQDHIKRKTLDLTNISMLVLDEADEMLRMGFAEEVEKILEYTPDSRQTALFSATMSSDIKKIALSHMQEPVTIKVKSCVKNSANIEQKYWLAKGLHKLDALSRIIETTDFNGLIVFARTKSMTTELATNLSARGFKSVAINGDLLQRQRERIIKDLKSGEISIVIATDVAARGIDVDRISHVINFDMPTDVESYVHRIGRTGRAGRSGQAISFVSPRERFMLKAITELTGQKIEELELPSMREVNTQRVAKFKAKITANLEDKTKLDFYKSILEQYHNESGVDYIEMAAGLAAMAQGDEKLVLKESKITTSEPKRRDRERPSRAGKNFSRGEARGSFRANRDRDFSDRGSDRGNFRGNRDRDCADRVSDRGNFRGNRDRDFADRGNPHVSFKSKKGKAISKSARKGRA